MGSFDKVIVIEDTCRVVSTRSRPSSRGSHVSVMSVEVIEVIWWSPWMRLLRISAMVTVLLMALPMAFRTTCC
jgi:hypothetical protein